MAGLNPDPANTSLNVVVDRIYAGTVGDDSDSFLTVEHDGADKLYMGGFTRSTEFETVAVTGDKDSVLVTLTY